MSQNIWYVYMILCRGNTIYTGVTTNVEQRFERHKKGKGGRYTRSHRVVRLLYLEELRTRGEALKREAQIKGLRREEKTRLINYRSLETKKLPLK